MTRIASTLYIAHFLLAYIFLFNRRQNLYLLPVLSGLHLFIVHLYAVIEVDVDAGEGEVGDFGVVVLGLFELLGQLVLALLCGGDLAGVTAVVE